MRLLLFYMIYISANVYCDILRIPLYKSTPSRNISEKFNAYVNNENMGDGPAKPANMSIYYNEYYYGEIRIGTPEQIIKVVIDTFEAYLYVQAANSSYCKANCYNISASETSHEYTGPLPNKSETNNFKISLSLDKLSIGELTVKDQVLMNVGYSKDFLQKQFGILGLSYTKTIDQCDHRASVISNMIHKVVLKENIFCIYFNRDIDSTLAGQLVLGGSDHNQYKGEIKYLPTISEIYWKINMDKVVMGDDFILCYGEIPTFIKSAQNFIHGPRSVIEQIHEAMNATLREEDKLYIVDCSTTAQLPDIHFTFDGRVFTLNGEDYIIKELDPICFSAFIFTKHEVHPSTDYENGYWVLGNPFLKTVYTQFELVGRRIGFAERKFNSQ